MKVRQQMTDCKNCDQKTVAYFLQASNLFGNLESGDLSCCQTVGNLSDVLPNKFGPQSNWTTENMTDTQVNQILLIAHSMLSTI